MADSWLTAPGTHADLIPDDHRLGTSGTSTGVNIAPGSDDDGWIVPPVITLADGTKVQLYKDGEALHAAYNALAHAKRRICVEVYCFADDDTGHAFAELLCRQSKAGVRVYVIYDPVGSYGLSGALRGQETIDVMRRAGVRVREFHPLAPWRLEFSWRPYNRNHRKMIVVDDHLGGLGGMNIGAEYAGSWVVKPKSKLDPWRDTAMGIEGPSVKLLLRSFRATWNYLQRGGRISRAQVIQSPAEVGSMGLLSSVPGSSPLPHMLRGLFRGAKRSIDLTMAYFAPGDELVDDLVNAARRGVRVRMMLPGRSDIRLLITAARSFYDTLLDEGIEVYERQGAILHAKSMVIDGETCVIGSANLDYRSIEYNLEISAIVRSGELGAQMGELFAHDVAHAVRIDAASWRQRPTLDRLVQWAVKRARYLL